MKLPIEPRLGKCAIRRDSIYLLSVGGSFKFYQSFGRLPDAENGLQQDLTTMTSLVLSYLYFFAASVIASGLVAAFLIWGQILIPKGHAD